jgi:hypothetical protein
LDPPILIIIANSHLLFGSVPNLLRQKDHITRKRAGRGNCELIRTPDTKRIRNLL